jgi:hypothetical protein
MPDFLFIPSPSANGGRIRFGLNDIPRLFSDGLDEPSALTPLSTWQSLWQAFSACADATFAALDLKLTAFLKMVVSRRMPFEASDIKSVCAASQGRQTQARA